MSVTSQSYSIPVVFQDLRPQESYIQAADALARLEELAEHVFGSIQARLGVERERLMHIDGRLGVAQDKIKQVADQTARATTVFSPARYPAPPAVPVMPPVFTEQAFRDPSGPAETKHIRHRALRDAPHMPPDLASRPPTSPGETLLDELFATKDGATALASQQKLADREGLGRLPPNLPSISNMLLFNTGYNPYKSYVSLDNLASKKKTGREGQEESDERVLADAPTTFTEGDVLPAVATLDYDYKPVLGDVPELDIPSVLPNLDGVADLLYTGGAVGSIAPSAVEDMLPDIAPAETSESPSATTADSGSAPAAPPPPAAAPPPPPPPAAAPPPPPGPPSDMPSALTDEGPGDAPSAPPPEGVPDLSGRGGLLADIRLGHKGRLKSAAKRKLKESAPAPADDAGAGASAPAAGTGDIFGDLMQALNRRRVGIAATRDKEEKRSEKAEADLDISAPVMGDDWDE